MDNSMQNIFYGGSRGTFTPRTRQSSASSLASNRKPLSSFKKNINSGRYSVSGRSTQSAQIIARSDSNIVESYGLPLPVLVNEALTFYDRNAVVSINCSPHGWAWAVCGRRLLVWQYKESNQSSPKLDSVRTPNRRTASGQCRELTLPHCDIGHKASLVSVFLADGQQMASCLAVSPTGDVRYWPSIAHDGSSIDESGILEGQELDELLNISPIGYVLATTTCSLVLLQLQLSGGRHTIVHRAIKPPTGFLGGIGKKFASIIIGINSNHDKEHKFLKICGEKQRNSDWIISVLSDRWIQRWQITSNGNEIFLYEDFEIFRKIRDVFHQKLWTNRDPNEIDIKSLTMQPCGSTKLVILVAAINETQNSQIYYALISVTEEGQTLTLSSYTHINHNTLFLTTNSSSDLKMGLILNRGVAYAYDDKIIYQIYTNEMGCEETEKIEFPAQDDKIMAAAVYNNIPLFFSRLYGLVCISPADMEAGDFFNNSVTSDLYNAGGVDNSFLSQSVHYQNESEATLTVYQLNPEDVYNTDTISQLKAAFIYHLKKNIAKSLTIVSELLDGDEQRLNVKFEEAVITVARDLAEDIPAADPRWDQMMATKNPLGGSTSMQIIQQLKDKNFSFNHFISFLKSMSLWEKLGTVSDRGNPKSTCQLLADINEKIIAAIALKKIHNTYSNLIDEAILTVLKNRNEQTSGNLTPQDLFYVKVSRIHEIFKVLANVGDEYIQNEQLAARTSSTLLDVVAIVLSVLGEVIKFRESKSEQYKIPSHKANQFEYLPWTAASGKNGMRDILLHLITVTLKYGARSTGEPELRQKHYKQLIDLIDFVLDGRKNYLESIKDSEKYNVLLQQYESQRTDLITPLVIDGQYELAAKLAEKYFDFHILVQICDRTENQARLDEYIEKYKDMGFSQFAINWHLKQNKQGDLFQRFKRNQQELSKFLGDHPSLAWIQSVFNGKFDHASDILLALAQNETELIARKKTMLSLAKLCFLTTENYQSLAQIAHINSELGLVAYQESLPQNLLASFGYDTDNPNVLKAEEIINLLISKENENATEHDYRKALELLQYVEDAIDVRHKIWCSAILRDEWTAYNPNSPLEDLQNMMLFKLIDLCFFLDAEIDDFLPPIEDFLEAPELETLTADKSFQFLLKLGYEHIYETYKHHK